MSVVPAYRGEPSAFAGVSDEQEQKQRHLELAMRFLVHAFVPYDGKLDVEEYIDEGAITLARNADGQRDSSTLIKTFDLLYQAAGPDTLRRFDGERHTGKIGLVALKAIAVGVARNIAEISKLAEPATFVRDRLRSFWGDANAASFTSPGVRGTTRFQRTVPFGANWFRAVSARPESRGGFTQAG